MTKSGILSKYSVKEIAQYPYLVYNSDAKFRSKNYSNIPSVIDSGTIYSTINARSALEIGIYCLNLKKGDEVLLPAYHCPVMVYPILKYSGKPVFYKVKTDCSVNVNDLKQKINSRTKAILIVHYFGFPTSIAEIRDMCDEKEIFLIEDCAHAFFGYVDNSNIGTWGDFSIASLWKFFPVCQGGFLRFKNKELSKCAYTIRPPFFPQLKSALNTIEMGSDIKKERSFRKTIFKLKDRVWKSLKPDQENSDSKPKKISNNPYSLEVVAETYSYQEMPFFSKFIYKMTNKKKLIYQRRRNFNILLKAFKSVVGIKPLFNELPPNVVPYVFPIISNNADELVKQLRSQCVNISRFGEHPWDYMDKKTCDISSFYSKHCIQLPIHQSLTLEDMKYMIDVIKSIYI